MYTSRKKGRWSYSTCRYSCWGVTTLMIHDDPCFFLLFGFLYLGPLESLRSKLYASLEAEAATLVWAPGVVRLMHEVHARSLFQPASDHQDVVFSVISFKDLKVNFHKTFRYDKLSFINRCCWTEHTAKICYLIAPLQCRRTTHTKIVISGSSTTGFACILWEGKCLWRESGAIFESFPKVFLQCSCQFRILKNFQ